MLETIPHNPNPSLEELRNDLAERMRALEEHKKKAHEGKLGVNCHDCNNIRQAIEFFEFDIRNYPAPDAK